jgi:5-methylcytosine-specific restriction protein A
LTCKPSSPASTTEKRRGSSASRGYGYKWQLARAAFLKMNPLCVDPSREHLGRVKAATDVDHIIPHRGDEKLFWDRKNWQGLCHECHSSKTAREDGGFGGGGRG